MIEVVVDGATNSIEYVCRPDGPWQWGMFGIEIAILCYGVVLAYSVHKAPAFFNEAKLIAFAIYNWLLISVLCQVVLLLVSVRKDPQYAIQSIAILLQISMTILFLFGSKLWIVYKGKGNERDKVLENTSKGTVASRIGGATENNDDGQNNLNVNPNSDSDDSSDDNNLDDSDSDTDENNQIHQQSEAVFIGTHGSTESLGDQKGDQKGSQV